MQLEKQRIPLAPPSQRSSSPLTAVAQPPKPMTQVRQTMPTLPLLPRASYRLLQQTPSATFANHPVAIKKIRVKIKPKTERAKLFWDVLREKDPFFIFLHTLSNRVLSAWKEKLAQLKALEEIPALPSRETIFDSIQQTVNRKPQEVPELKFVRELPIPDLIFIDLEEFENGDETTASAKNIESTQSTVKSSSSESLISSYSQSTLFSHSFSELSLKSASKEIDSATATSPPPWVDITDSDSLSLSLEQKTPINDQTTPGKQNLSSQQNWQEPTAALLLSKEHTQRDSMVKPQETQSRYRLKLSISSPPPTVNTSSSGCCPIL